MDDHQGLALAPGLDRLRIIATSQPTQPPVRRKIDAAVEDTWRG